MIWLILGVLLWSLSHLFKRLAPGPRASMGDGGKGAVAVSLLVAIVLMVMATTVCARQCIIWRRSCLVKGATKRPSNSYVQRWTAPMPSLGRAMQSQSMQGVD